jgi:TolB protein
VSDRDGTYAIYLANEDGSAVTKLVPGWGPAWSRSGRQIAFSNGDIYLINVDGSGLRFVTDGREPGWSPDERWLVFQSGRRGSEIDTVNVDGSNRRSVFDSDGQGSYDPTWSPDGQQILFSVGTFINDCFGLWTVSPDGSGARQFHGPGTGRPPRGGCFFEDATFGDAWRPAWSTDGSEIAFTTPGGIEVARADGSGRHLRVPGPADHPDWTPAGRLIYTKGRFNDATRIFISDGGAERQLIPDATAPARASYSDWQAVWLR